MVKNQIGLSVRSYPNIRSFIESGTFAVCLMLLIVVSVVLIIVEYLVPMSTSTLNKVQLANDLLTFIFIVELSLRWLISSSTRSYFKSFWIDILATVPMFRIFRLGRVLRILRLFRIFSLGPVIQRRFSFMGRFFEGRMIEYGIIVSFVLFAVIFGAVGLTQFEMGVSEDITTPIDAFWKSIFSIVSGEYADHPISLGGKFVVLVLLIFEMGVFAMLTGTFSAIMIDKLKESAMHKPTNPDELNQHIIICGFSTKVPILASEFLLDPAFAHSEILLISEKAGLDELIERGVDISRISLMTEDFTRLDVLKRAGVERAVAAVILSEPGENRTTQDMDARTILAALTIEKLNPRIHTSAEMYNEGYASHLKMGGVEDVVLHGEVSGKLLARIAMHEGLLAFFKDLLSRESGNTLNFIDPPEEAIGKSVDEVMSLLQKELGFIMVGIKPKTEQLKINPRHHILESTDEILVIKPVLD